MPMDSPTSLSGHLQLAKPSSEASRAKAPPNHHLQLSKRRLSHLLSKAHDRPRRCTPPPLAPTAATCHICSLPDEALLLIFSPLGLQERHAVAALVCRRWSQLLIKPALVQCIALRLAPSPAQLDSEASAHFPSRLRAFAAWLDSRAARHLSSLHLQLFIPQTASPGRLRRSFSQLKAALAGRCHGLTELRLDVDRGAKLSGWVAALPGLHTLQVCTAGKLQLAADLQELSALSELHLQGCPLRIRPEAQLPAGLTSLVLAGDSRSPKLPHQLTVLTSLASLALEGGGYASSGYTHLSRFGGTLRELSLADCLHLPTPASLVPLTALKTLSVRQQQLDASRNEPTDEASAWLQHTLAALPGLSSLRLLGGGQGCLPAFPAQLAGLTRLVKLEWHWPAPTDPALPVGPWLARLLRLTLPVSVAAASLPILSAAWQLQALAVHSGEQCSHSLAAHLSEVVGWAARHPSLQQLELQRLEGGEAVEQLEEDVGLAEALKEATQLNPGLHIAGPFCRVGGCAQLQ